MAVQAAEGADFTASEIAAGAYFFGAALPGTSNNNHRKGLVKNIMLADGGTQTGPFNAAAGYSYKLDNTAPTKTFTFEHTTDIATFASGYIPQNGERVILSNSGGALPTGLSAQMYVVISASGQTCQFALTPGGAAVTASNNGTGTHSATIPLQIVLPSSPSAGDRVAARIIRSNANSEVSWYGNGTALACSSFLDWSMCEVNEYLVLEYDSTPAKWTIATGGDGRADLFQRSTRAAAQGMTNDSFSPIEHDTHDSTNRGFIVESSGVYRPRRSGWLIANAMIRFPNMTDGNQCQCNFWKNSAVMENALEYVSITGGYPIVKGAAAGYVNAYDKIQNIYYQNSGGTKNTETDANIIPRIALKLENR